MAAKKTNILRASPKRIWALLDANFNRAREGLRVVEDIERFCYRRRKFLKLRDIRHKLSKLFSAEWMRFAKSRDTSSDRGANVAEGDRSNLKEIFVSNIFRTSEALRVLEEILKLYDGKLAGEVKKLRFSLYDAEQDIVKGGFFDE